MRSSGRPHFTAAERHASSRPRFGGVGAAAACVVGCCSAPLLASGIGIAVGGGAAFALGAGVLAAICFALFLVAIGMRARRSARLGRRPVPVEIGVAPKDEPRAEQGAAVVIGRSGTVR